MRPITDPRFKYTNAAQTDVRKTFERVRRRERLLARIRLAMQQRKEAAQ